MAINEKDLSKGEIRKLTALKKSVGDKLGEKIFAEWFSAKPAAAAENIDPIAVKIEEALAGYAKDKEFKLGVRGYSVRRAKGKGASGFVAAKIE